MAEDYIALRQWAQKQKNTLGPRLAVGQFPYPFKEYGYLPEVFFDHDAVQAKFNEMKHASDDIVPPANKQRIPEKDPYYSPSLLKRYLLSLASDMNEKSYEIYIMREQPKAVFFQSIPRLDDVGLSFKIHLMFNVKYINTIMPILFNELIKPSILRNFPIYLKLLSYNPVTAVPNRAGMPVPDFEGSKVPEYEYGSSHEEKAKYGRLAESFIYSPTEIKKFKPTVRGFNKFRLDAVTKKKKVINELYDMESLFDPVLVFYASDREYIKALLEELLRIFPDERTTEWVLPNFYPRGNVKINNMIYLANGDFGTKYNKKQIKCTFNQDVGRPVCWLNPNYPLGDLPTEYQAIQDTCESRGAKPECDAANRLPLAVSNNKLCKWEEDKCTPEKTYSQHLILQDYNSLEQLYGDIGQTAAFERLKAGNANGSLPVNYGGRRAKKTRRNKRKNKNKSRRAH
jgi:hypothetical protein